MCITCIYIYCTVIDTFSLWYGVRWSEDVRRCQKMSKAWKESKDAKRGETYKVGLRWIQHYNTAGESMFCNLGEWSSCHLWNLWSVIYGNPSHPSTIKNDTNTGVALKTLHFWGANKCVSMRCFVIFDALCFDEWLMKLTVIQSIAKSFWGHHHNVGMSRVHLLCLSPPFCPLKEAKEAEEDDQERGADGRLKRLTLILHVKMVTKCDKSKRYVFELKAALELCQARQ